MLYFTSADLYTLHHLTAKIKAVGLTIFGPFTEKVGFQLSRGDPQQFRNLCLTVWRLVECLTD